MNDTRTVFVVDDDAAVLRSMARILRAANVEARTFQSPAEFLANHDPEVPGCALLDIAMPALDGLQLQTELSEHGIERPIIFITGKGDIPTSVRAMKAGAVDFLTKPVKAEQLLDAVARAMERDAQARHERDLRSSIDAKLRQLTPREREVLSHVVAGRLNKQIAGDLGTVEKTIKVHRGRMMSKMGVRTVADLVRVAAHAGIGPHL
jgi:FixJ family two-component response regulator